ncbi:MAG: hypothetical protein GY861_07050 [bacterium]|nr:hypothetical protein [bacterium]
MSKKRGNLKQEFANLREINFKETKQKLKQSVKEDMLIIQTAGCIDELNRASNLLVKRLREWYELYNPEYSRAVPDHEKFVKSITSNDKKALLKEIKLTGQDMGAELSEKDLKPILDLAKETDKMYSLIEVQKKYLETLMTKSAPNLNTVAGALIGAKLVALAGSFKRLAEFPASTIQLLGAEKALFRHIRNKSMRPPKFGVIHEHPLIGQAERKNKGKAARALADKLSIAVKIDYFKGEFIGDKLKNELEKRFKK